MKKWKLVLSFLMILIFMSSTALAFNGNITVTMNRKSQKVKEVPIVIDGQSIYSDTPTFIHGGNTFIPIRFLTERYGAKVGWDQKTQTAIINQNGKEIKMTINSRDVYVDGKKTRLDSGTVPELVTFPAKYKLDGPKTMVPLRFISEALGYEVGYDAKVGVPFINTSKQPEEDKKENPRKVTEVGIENSNTKRPRITINGTKNLSYSTVELDNPNKLIIDIKDAALDLKSGKDAIKVNGKLINNIDISQHSKDPDIVRISIDLKEKSEFDIIPGNNGKTITLSFVNKVGKITKEVVGGKEAIVVHNTSNPETKIMKLKSPERVVIDILDSSLENGKYIEYKHDLESIKGIRVSQFVPDKNYTANARVVRVVLDIKDLVSNPKIKIDTYDNKIVIIPEPYVIVDKDKDKDKDNNNVKPGSKLIFIDPGHGGKDSGACSPSGTKEKDIALSISKKLDQSLKAKGYSTLMSRDGDYYPTNPDRAKMANASNADIYVSIHANSFTSSSPSGIEVLYNPKKGSKDKALASVLMDELARETGANNRGIKERPRLVVLNQTKMPSALVEVGFLSNLEEEKLIKDDAYQDRMVEAMVRAIDKYFQTN